MLEVVSCFADVVTLLYHEGRNVRHLAKNQPSVKTKFLTLANLAKNRYTAWKQIQPLRQEVARAQSGSDVQRVFKLRFRLTLDDMVDLYSHPGWKDAPSYGGNAWSPIARQATEVRDLLDSNQEDNARQLLEQILVSHHNTGKVSEKIKELDNFLASSAN